MSERLLVATADCPACLSKYTIFDHFHGELICPGKSKPAQGVRIVAEVHHCRSCGHEFEKTDGPWIGLELAAWQQAMRHGMEFDGVPGYTDWIRNTLRRATQ